MLTRGDRCDLGARCRHRRRRLIELGRQPPPARPRCLHLPGPWTGARAALRLVERRRRPAPGDRATEGSARGRSRTRCHGQPPGSMRRQCNAASGHVPRRGCSAVQKIMGFLWLPPAALPSRNITTRLKRWRCAWWQVAWAWSLQRFLESSVDERGGAGAGRGGRSVLAEPGTLRVLLH